MATKNVPLTEAEIVATYGRLSVPVAGTRIMPVPNVMVGDILPSWLGEVVAIRETPKRRYFTVRRIDGTEITEHQSRMTQILVRPLAAGRCEIDPRVLGQTAPCISPAEVTLDETPVCQMHHDVLMRRYGPAWA